MSKKVLNYAGKRPMLLALIVMATLTLGLLFSGWLTPARAQQGDGNPPPNQEATNCIVAYMATNCTDGSVTLSNIPPAIVCIGSGVGAGTSTIITTGLQVVVTGYTNAGNAGNDACPPNLITNTPTPTLVSNWWTASGCGIGTNGTGLDTSSTPLIPTNAGIVTITFNQKWQDICDSTTNTATTVATNYVAELTHQCVLTMPTNQTRTIVGVGEQVNLSINGLPPIASITWTMDNYDGSDGFLSARSGATTVWTAPNYAANGSQACTIKAIYWINGSPAFCSVTFTVLNPTSVNMTLVYPTHTTGTVNIGMWTQVYVAPASVNFSAVKVREEVVDGYGIPVSFVGWGCYRFGGVHGTVAPISLSTIVDSTNGTKAVTTPTDNAEIAGSGVAEGGTLCAIPVDWNCNNNDNTDWNNFPSSANCNETGTSVAIAGSTNDFQLTVTKSGATYSCKVSDPTLTYP